MNADWVVLCDWFVWSLKSMKVLGQWCQTSYIVVDLVDVIVIVQYGRSIYGLDVALRVAAHTLS